MSGVIGGIAAGAVLLILRAAAGNASASIRASNGTRIARYTTVARALPWFLALIALGLWAALLQAPPDQLRTGLIVCVSLSVGILLLFLEFTFARVAWSESGLMFHSPWRKSRKINWQDVVEVRFSARLSWVVVRSRSGTVIRLPTLFGGLGELLETLKRRVAPSLHASIDEALAFLRMQRNEPAKSMPDLQSIEIRLLGVLDRFDGALPSAELDDMRELCRAGEAGISLKNFSRNLASTKFGSRLPTPPSSKL